MPLTEKNYVDTTETTSCLEWCAGYGGISLGLKRAIPNLRTIAFGEIEAFACANLVAKMEAGLLDAAPIWTDIKTFPCEAFRDRVDILVAGYPCQPFSAAGKRLGTEDPRHLWPHIARAISIIRPRLCFFENVEGHISLGLSTVISDLEELGYKVSWGIFSASEVGAPHQRKRVFILAVSNSLGGAAGLSRSLAWNEGITGVADHGGGKGGGVADSKYEHDRWLQREGQLCEQQESGACGQRVVATSNQVWPSRPGEPQYGWEPPRVVVDAKSQRAGQRSELCSKECGSGSALPWDVEQSGEGAMADPNELRLEEHGLQHAGVSVGSSGGQNGEASGLPNAQSMRLEEQSECGQQREADGERTSNAGRVCPCEAQEGRSVEHASDWSNGEQPTEQQGRHSVGGSGEEGAMGNATHTNRRTRVSAEEAGAGPDDIWRRRSGESGERQTQPSLGLHPNEYSGFLGQALTLNPYGDNVYAYENISKKIRAREVLFSVWREAISKEIQWTTGGLQCFLAEKILQSGMQLDSFIQRICYFVWCIQTSHEAQGWGLHGMWVYETCGNSSQGQEPVEQFKRELGYAMCQLSYEIALEGRKDVVEAESILQGVREASERAWALSQALPEMEEVWRSSLDQAVWEKGCYIEATSIGNRTDELRLLGNGVVPATAERAFRVLIEELNK